MTPEALKAWREHQELRQEDLAELLGVDRMTVSRWERATREIPPFLHLALEALAERARIGKARWLRKQRRVGGPQART